MSLPSTNLPHQLDAAWRRVLLPFHVPEPAVTTALADLAARYSEPSRHYHNLTHLHEVLEVVNNLAGVDVPAIQLAAWFHDAIYDSRAKDNEERSADLAKGVLIPLGLPAGLVVNVQRLVLLTKTHTAEADDWDGQRLLDADLAILGAEVDRYDDYANAIRREYAWVAEDDYRSGRSHEGRARRNLLRECDRLTFAR
jgi:predicted metal-dependent HD superfamily phosphohydrolase